MRNTLSYQQSTYENDKIKSAQMAVDTSLNERVLDVDTMNATVESETALVPFQQNTPVRFLRGGSQYALWYLAQITRVAPKLWALSMTSSLGRLTQMPHKGGIYNGVAASAIIDDICGVVPHFVGAAFQNVLLYGWLPYVAPSGENGAQTGSAKDNLLKVLFALNATVRDDADGTLRIENLSTAVSARLSPARIYRDNASVVTEPTVTAVTVLEHQYITGSETTTLFEGTTVDGQVIVFREPMSNLTATGFTVTESNANYAVVSAGSGTLTGTPYIHTTREITKPVTAAAIPNAVRIEDATLVGVTNSSDVVNRLVDYYSHRTYINVDATIDLEDAGDVVDIYDPFDKLMRTACIEKISPLIVSQTMKGRISALVGFTPWQVVPFEDVRELLTGSGTWPLPDQDIPDGADVSAVLIGKGLDGTAGASGERGTGRSLIVTSSEQKNGGTWTIQAGPGGAGGKGGEGGQGGKIYRVNFIYHTGDQISFDASLSDVEFGQYSSSQGARSDAGYLDPITGDTFAAKGSDGTEGAKGGTGGIASLNDARDGSRGGSVGEKTGGHGGSPSHYEDESSGLYGYMYIRLGGGGGGGASSSGNGNAGYTGNGGTGASASAQPAKTVYGTGGDGGNGGGGGGGTGAAYYRYGKYQYPGEPSGIWYTPSAGAGGAGGEGGAGAPGCIILYYRRPVTE